MASRSVNIALLDKHRICRDGLESLLKDVDGMSVVGSVSDISDLVKCLSTRDVNVVIMELVNAGADHLRELKNISDSNPDVRFLVLSHLPESSYALRVLRAGASGYLMKDVSFRDLLLSIRKVADGSVALSPAMAESLLENFSTRRNTDRSPKIDQLSNRELHVLNLVAQGHKTAGIALLMGIGSKTVSTYKERIKEKLDLSNSTQLTQAAIRWLGSSQYVDHADAG